MSANVGGLDRLVRIVIAVVAVIGAIALGFGSVWAWVLVVVAAILLVTSVVGFCPLYRLIGASTRRARSGA